jgi:hypothetical protein
MDYFGYRRVQHLDVKCFNASTCYSGGFNTSATVGGMFKSAQVLATSEVAGTIKHSSIYPNPTQGEINIKTDKKVKTTSVLDFSGKSVMKTDAAKPDLSSLPKGTYLIQIEFTDGTSSTEKVIKQ